MTGVIDTLNEVLCIFVGEIKEIIMKQGQKEYAIQKEFLKRNNVIIKFEQIHHYNKTWNIVKHSAKCYEVEGDTINTYRSQTSAAYWTVKNHIK